MGAPPDAYPRATKTRIRALEAAGRAIDLSDYYPGTGEHEVAFALHTQRRIVARYPEPGTQPGTVLRSAREAWKLSFNEEWITGTCDWLDDFLGVPWIDDLKTGSWVPSNPWDLWQLRFYAVCATMLTGSPEVAVSITHWPRSPADGLPKRIFVPGNVVTREELLGYTLPMLEYARQAREKSILEGPDTRPGSHCTYCPSANHCPALSPTDLWSEDDE